MDKTITVNHKSVRDLAEEEQPRIRLERYGSESLTEAELLAILLRTGSGQMNVLDTARRLLEHFHGLRNLSRKDWHELRVIPGIARVKALTLEASFELSRRLAMPGTGDKIEMKSPEAVNTYFGPMLRDYRNETFVIAFLNAAKVMIGYRKISNGGPTATIVEPAEVMRQAIMNDAHSIIVLHNHPSGNKKESRADIQLTKRLIRAGKLIGINVEDHVIIAGHDFISLRAKGYWQD